MHRTRVHEDGPRVWGMLERVTHMVKIERVRAEDADKVRDRPDTFRKMFNKWEPRPEPLPPHV